MDIKDIKKISNNTGTTHHDSLQGSCSADQKDSHNEVICARLFICALWSLAGKGLTSWLSFVVSAVSLSLSNWYPGSGVVLDCIDS